MRGIEYYPGCDYTVSTHHVFDVDEPVRYVRFSDVLAEVPRQERDQESQEYCHEEQETGHPGRLPDLRHQGIQNRQVGCHWTASHN